MKRLTQAARFPKEQIPEVGALKGTVNNAPVGDHPEGRLRFLRFEGAHAGDQMYEGDLVFEILPEVDASGTALELAAEKGEAIASYLSGSGERGQILVADVREADGSPLADFSLLVEGMESAHGN